MKRYKIYGADSDGTHVLENDAGQIADNVEDGTEFVLASECEAETRRLKELLGLLYDKWENGTPCYQDADESNDSLGNAFKLTDDEENAVLAALGMTYPSTNHQESVK